MANKTILVESMSVGHNNAEIYIRLGEIILILSPAAAKKFTQELAELPQVAGAKLTDHTEKRYEPISKQILKALYKGRKVTKSLIAINTKRRKKLPDG